MHDGIHWLFDWFIRATSAMRIILVEGFIRITQAKKLQFSYGYMMNIDINHC